MLVVITVVQRNDIQLAVEGNIKIYKNGICNELERISEGIEGAMLVM